MLEMNQSTLLRKCAQISKYFRLEHSDRHLMLLFYVQKFPVRVGNRRYFERFDIWILERETLTRTLNKRCLRSTLASAAAERKSGRHLKRD